MTLEEVIEKWDKKHHSTLYSILSLVKETNDVITLHKDQRNSVVASQILSDLGFSLTKITRVNGKKTFYTYTKISKVGKN